MASFEQRLQQAMGPSGYDNSMRRSVQTACLYEANRCLSDRLPSLRPFQRKIALLDMAQHLLQTVNLPTHIKEEIMYRTATSKEPLNTDVAWKRMKLIDREIAQIIQKLRPFLADHNLQEACEIFVQTQYETVTSNKKPHPRNWEHTHNNVFLTYRMYYQGENLRLDLPSAKPPKQIVVPAEKPDKSTVTDNPSNSYFLAVGNESQAVAAGHAAENTPGKEADINDDELEAIVNQGETTVVQKENDRRLILKEVREHLDLLKEFEGVIPQEELTKRKRELFLAMPSAPPPARKKSHLSGGTECV